MYHALAEPEKGPLYIESVMIAIGIRGFLYYLVDLFFIELRGELRHRVRVPCIMKVKSIAKEDSMQIKPCDVFLW